MKKIAIVFTAFMMLSCNSEKANLFEIENKYDTDVADYGVVFTRSDLAQKMEIPDVNWPMAYIGDHPLPTQSDDLDGDGEWDELFFIVDLEAGEKKQVEIRFVNPTAYPEFKNRTNIRFARKDKNYQEEVYAVRETHAINTETQKVWQMEGIAWENDKIGFRNYFDRRNGMDIFGKITEEMVLDGVGYKDSPNYHAFNPDWGMDVLKVGNSLGSGSIAYMYKDSLYRVGDNGSGTCRILAEGPIRSIFRLEFPDWKIGDQEVSVTHDIMIQAGKYYYENRVTYEGLDEPLQLVAGIVNMKSDAFHEAGVGEHYKAFYTHAEQSEDTTYLGMGLKVPAEDFAGTSETPDSGEGIIQTYCVHMNAKPGEPVSFRFYSVWEREDSKWKDPENFEKLLAGV